MTARASALAALAAASLLSGCYGSTEPATNVKIDSATFQGRGTTNGGPSHVYFEFWPVAFPQQHQVTLGKDVPAGASGPFSDENSPFPGGLAAATRYAFRLCGRDDGAAAVCAQTRTFSTVTPPGDAVSGSPRASPGSASRARRRPSTRRADRPASTRAGRSTSTGPSATACSPEP